MTPNLGCAWLVGALLLSACSFDQALRDCEDGGRCVGTPSAESTVLVSPTTGLADGKSLVTVTVTVVDTKGRVMPNQRVTLWHDGRVFCPTPVRTDASGVATFSLTMTEPWEGPVTVTVDDTYELTQHPTVRFGPEWVRVSTGWDHTLAVKGDGTVWAWGGNASAQLGDGSESEQRRPVRIGQGALDVAAGDGDSAELGEGGSLLGWGYASWESSPPVTPVALSGPLTQGFSALVAGSHHFLAIHRDGGTLWAWGSSGENRLGDGTGTSRGVPGPVLRPSADGGGSPLADVVAISAGRAHSLALQRDGGLWAWGNDNFGQLGASGNGARPVQVTTELGFVAVAAGESHSLAIKADGSLWAWGDNSSSQLGLDLVGPQKTPRLVKSGSFVAVAAGANHSLALTDGGTLYAWGCGPASPTSAPTCASPQPLAEGFIAVSGGGWHSAAIKADGSLWLWGSNESGQLGDGTGPGVRPSPARLHP